MPTCRSRPSSVAPQHCILFRYEQHWAVLEDVAAANGGATSGTFVNGQQVFDPVMLQIGDVISIGPDPAAATIDVDPTAAAEGRTGWAGESSERDWFRHMAPRRHMWRGGRDSGVWQLCRRPAGFSPGLGTHVTCADGRACRSACVRSGSQTGSDHIDLGAHVDHHAEQLAAGTSGYTRRRRKTGTPTGGLIAVVVVGIVMAGGVVSLLIWCELIGRPGVKFVREQRRQPPPELRFATKARLRDDCFVRWTCGGACRPARFSAGHAASGHARPGRHAKPLTEPSGADHTRDRAGSTREDSGRNRGHARHRHARRRDDDAGDASHSGAPATCRHRRPFPPARPGRAFRPWSSSPTILPFSIFGFATFQKLHPGQHTDELVKFTEDKFDQLWWDRITMLLKKRIQLTTDIKKKQADIDETYPTAKKKELAEKAQMEKDVKIAGDTLVVRMGYLSNEPPADLSAARNQRMPPNTRHGSR